MSQYANDYYGSYSGDIEEPRAAEAQLIYKPREKWLVLPFAPAVICSGLSWMSGGLPFLTDASFVILAGTCFFWVLNELFWFTRRFGLGAVIFAAGVLLWFCHDYFKTWFGHGSSIDVTGVSTEILAKAAFLTCLLVQCMAIGMYLRPWQRALNLVEKLPEPRSVSFYPVLIVICLIIGWLPYFFFASEAWYVTLWKSIWAGRSGGVGFTTGRTGNVNTSYGAYLAQLMQIGQMGSLLAVFYAVLIARNGFFKIFCWLYWLIYAAEAFGSGTRGTVAFAIMPVLGILFLRYQAQAASLFKRFSLRAYFLALTFSAITLVVIQIQVTYRNVGFHDIQLDEVKTDLEGNTMFSEGLKGMVLIPDKYPFFQNAFPGQGIIMPIPDTIRWFLIGPIPRAMFPSKPIDPMWSWYNHVVTGRPIDKNEGTTVSTGLVGGWYFKFGVFGVIEGGLLIGWLYMMFERMLLNSQGRPIQMMLAVSLLIFLFRCFRGWGYHNLYPILIGVTAIVIIIKVWDLFFGGDETPAQA